MAYATQVEDAVTLAGTGYRRGAVNSAQGQQLLRFGDDWGRREGHACNAIAPAVSHRPLLRVWTVDIASGPTLAFLTFTGGRARDLRRACLARAALSRRRVR